VTERDDDFLAKPEPFVEPRRGGLNHGSSGYAAGLRGTRAECRASRRDETHTATRKAFVVGTGVMGAAVVAAATFTVLVFAGLFSVSSGVGGGNRPVTLVQQPPPTTAAASPSDGTDPTPSSDTEGAFPPSNTAQTGTSMSNKRVAVPRATASAQVPALSSSGSSRLAQLSSASSPPPSDALAPATPMTPTPNTNPAGHTPPGRNG